MRERFSGSIIAVAFAVAAVGVVSLEFIARASAQAPLRRPSSNTMRPGPSRCRRDGCWARWGAFASMRATMCSS